MVQKSSISMAESADDVILNNSFHFAHPANTYHVANID